MFGYIYPEKCELKLRDYETYEAYYCGVCKAISRRYGQIPRYVLNYDCTFVAVLLDGCMNKARFEKEKCAYKPLKEKKLVAYDSPSIDFAADLNVILAWFKVLDNINDNDSIKYQLARLTLKKYIKKAEKYSQALYNVIADGMAKINEIEKQKSDSLDAAASAFSQMMKNTVACSEIEGRSQRIPLENIMGELGRWVYIIDAWEDREDDRKNDSYNPFNLSGAGKDRAEFLMNISLNNALNAFDLLDVKKNGAIIENIIGMGCVKRTKNATQKE